ncbi:hypothetical protein [Massilia sp. TWR1-2-2]|uniref:hypothetical protein n=1 Tax=Massilia sp. TWR1-2-2 TaxID=2804584 RepID=UPI003CFA8D3E
MSKVGQADVEHQQGRRVRAAGAQGIRDTVRNGECVFCNQDRFHHARIAFFCAASNKSG